MTAPGPSKLSAIARIPRFAADQIAEFRYGWDTYGDLYHVNVPRWDLWVCSSPQQVKEILIDGQDIWQRIDETRWGQPFGLRMALGEGLLTTDGSEWQGRRHTMNPAFHRDLVNDMIATMIEAGNEMIRRIEGGAAKGTPINLITEMKRVTQDIVSRTLFSADLGQANGKVGDAIDEALQYVAKSSRSILDLPPILPTPAKDRFRRAMTDIDDAVYRGISHRRQSEHHGTDLLGLLLSATDEETGGPLSNEQIRNEVATIYGAGYETTANALTWTWHELMQNPSIVEQLQSETDSVDPADVGLLGYTRMVLEESLRFRPPVPINPRTATRPTGLSHFEVVQGATAFIVLTNLHRHPDHWERPESFDPNHFSADARAARDPYSYIPFGAGPHTCIGSNFAMIAGTILLAMLAREFTFRPATELPRPPAMAVTMKPAGGLPVFVTRR